MFPVHSDPDLYRLKGLWTPSFLTRTRIRYKMDPDLDQKTVTLLIKELNEQFNGFFLKTRHFFCVVPKRKDKISTGIRIHIETVPVPT